jgi:hypothetical protein
MRKDDQQAAATGLVGRFFHAFDQHGFVQFQGRVVSQIDETHYLVQFYEWIVGEANTIHIRTLAQMLEWQFNEDADHWRFWFEHRAPKRPRSIVHPTDEDIAEGERDAAAALP